MIVHAVFFVGIALNGADLYGLGSSRHQSQCEVVVELKHKIGMHIETKDLNIWSEHDAEISELLNYIRTICGYVLADEDVENFTLGQIENGNALLVYDLVETFEFSNDNVLYALLERLAIERENLNELGGTTGIHRADVICAAIEKFSAEQHQKIDCY